MKDKFIFETKAPTRRRVDPVTQFRQFCCPGCELPIENEIAVECQY